jgi:hypothetical protein
MDTVDFLKKYAADAITNPRTMAVRDRLLDNDYFNNKVPHAKRFLQYLTGGVKGDVITELPEDLKASVIEAHYKDNYPERKDSTWWAYKGMDGSPADKYILNDEFGKRKETYWDSDMDIDEIYVNEPKKYGAPNPLSTKLSTYYNVDPEKGDYISNKKINYQVGDIDSFTPDGKGGYTLNDVWTVTETDYDKPFEVFDLMEGGPLATLLYRGAKALGTNKPFRYAVPFSKEEMLRYKPQ